ncbi:MULTISPECIES: sigma-70 family RNA polymerase sigma factor [unclassified Pseudoalteromonas]|uniref:sigma-70 family RNA polymerase sigma factor n=1 Tax=unclassified Pseudoalteromonas TaxID=194690 RepID=UPI0025B56FB0|nr:MULTISPECIES: sigma-70 family RNA polymerase sigma factor [unclassified Pseudoalteromonas]MDN3378620.1 sigma-70 family RNA polymerase sigma factor [Pseudoalteromonas sp. APC 3893]MDN3386968.1 sigma-70 family RNA polymerase sigma factor [Pseudoalteromonas sp. APC 4017]
MISSPVNIASVDDMYKKHSNWLSIYIQRRLGCPEATADLVQDTYLRLLAKTTLPSLQDSRRYLTHIAKGLVIDLYRKRNVETAYLELIANDPIALSTSAESQLLMIEALTEIDNLLQQLPEKVRQALLMRQLENMSYKQIAKQLNVSVSSVEKYIARALQSCLMVNLEMLL